jgi:hypothetical protein
VGQHSRCIRHIGDAPIERDSDLFRVDSDLPLEDLISRESRTDNKRHGAPDKRYQHQACKGPEELGAYGTELELQRREAQFLGHEAPWFDGSDDGGAGLDCSGRYGDDRAETQPRASVTC